MSGAKAKLLASTLTMLIALLLVIGSTFAWFTISANPEISGIQFSVSTWENLLIARDDPEIDDPLNLDYKTTIQMNDIFSYYTELTPVSTVDLKNWFIPTYNASTGYLKPASEFIWDPDLRYANSFRVKTENGEVLFTSDGTTSSAIPLTGIELLNAQKQGYYVYADFWIKTEEKEGTVVSLSFPSYGVSKAAAAKELNNYFGTYVLPVLEAKQNANSEIYLSEKQYNSETAIRLGFAVYSDAIHSDEWSNWYIYEPNADKRSVYEEKPEDQDEYILGYIKSSAEEANGIYIETNPIGFPTSSGANQGYVPVAPEDETGLDWTTGLCKTVYTETDLQSIDSTATALTSSATYYISSGSIYTPVTGAFAYAYLLEDAGNKVYTRSVYRREARPLPLDPDHLIVQMAGAWDMSKQTDILSTLSVEGGRLDSRQVSYFGNFVSAASLYNRLNFLKQTVADCRTAVCGGLSRLWSGESTEPEGAPALQGDNTSGILLKLNYNEPVKIRLFVWVEGQDVDCWNDIAAGSVQINLEFAGLTRDEND